MRTVPKASWFPRYMIGAFCLGLTLLTLSRIVNKDEDPYQTIKKQQELQDPKYKKGMHDREWREQHGFDPIYYPKNNY